MTSFQRWNMEERERSVAIWLEECARRLHLWGKWKNILARQQLRDAYERGYAHRMSDEATGQSRPSRLGSRT